MHGAQSSSSASASSSSSSSSSAAVAGPDLGGQDPQTEAQNVSAQVAGAGAETKTKQEQVIDVLKMPDAKEKFKAK